MKPKPELYELPPAEALHRIFDFTAADLQANSEGRLSVRQMRRIRRAAFGYFIYGVIFAVGFIAIGIVVLALRRTPSNLFYAIPVLLVILFAAAGRLQNRNEKHEGLRVDARSDLVNRIVGTPHFITPTGSDEILRFAITVSGSELYLDEKQYYEFRAFVNTHRGYQEYVFYFLPDSRLVMSVRMIGLEVREWFSPNP